MKEVSNGGQVFGVFLQKFAKKNQAVKAQFTWIQVALYGAQPTPPKGRNTGSECVNHFKTCMLVFEAAKVSGAHCPRAALNVFLIWRTLLPKAIQEGMHSTISLNYSETQHVPRRVS